MYYFKNMKYIFYIGLALLLFPCWCLFIIKGSGAYIYVSSIVWFLLITLFVLYNKNADTKKIFARLLKIRSFRIFNYYILYIIISILSAIIFEKYTAPSYYYIVRIYKFFIVVLPLILFSIIALHINISIKKIIKLFYLLIWILMVVGIIQYLSFIFHINFLSPIFNFFANCRLAYTDIDYSSEYRVYAFFPEPSVMGQFIFITLPIAFNISLSNFKILKSTVLNFIVKKTMIPFVVITLIFTKSPIFLFLCLIELFILLLLYIKKYIYKYKIGITISICIFILMFFFIHKSINLEELIYSSYLYRIIKTIESLSNFNLFINKEPSLATRIVDFKIQIDIFLDNMLTGVGFCNSEVVGNKIMLSSSLPLTLSNYRRYYATDFVVSLEKSPLYTSLAELGLIGTILFYSFSIQLIQSLNKIKKKYAQLNFVIINSIRQVLIVMIISYFYSSLLNFFIYWFIYGISFAVLYNHYFLSKNKPLEL